MKNKLLVFLFMITMSVFMFGYFMQDKEASKSERRTLTTMSDVEKYSFTDRYFSEKFEQFALDQVMFRDLLRSVHSWWDTQIWLKKDYHGISFVDSYYFKQEKEINIDQIKKFGEQVNQIIEKFNVSSSLMVIPDKNMYKPVQDPFTNDYHQILETLQVVKGEVFNMFEVFTLEDYYYGDPHLRQEAYLKWLNKEASKYNKKEFHYFHGAYQSQMALSHMPENLSYYTNSQIEKAEIKHLEFEDKKTVYDEEGLTHMDSYDVFLSGASAFIEINNKEANSQKNLLVFRDSFGSSLVPLLVEDYQTIYVVDLRYMDYQKAMSLMDKQIDELLFIYGSQSVNQSMNLKW